MTVLIATGHVAQISYHPNRALDNGLTAEEAGEVLGHLAFYASWPNAFSAAPVVKDVIARIATPYDKRSDNFLSAILLVAGVTCGSIEPGPWRVPRQ